MMPPGRRAGARAAVRHAGAPHARRARPRDDIGAWLDEIDGDGELGEHRPRPRAPRAARLGARPPRARPSWRRARVQASAEGQAVWHDGARRRSTSPSSRPRSSATSSSRASTPRASTTASIPTTRCSADYDYGLTRGARAARSSTRSPRRCRRSSTRRRRGPRRPPLAVPVDAQEAAVARRPAPPRRGRAPAGASTSPRTRSACDGPHATCASRPATTTRERRVAAGRRARVRPRALRAPDRARARRARTSAAARRCRCTSRRASCGRTTSRAIRAFADGDGGRARGGRLHGRRRPRCTRAIVRVRPSLIRVVGRPAHLPAAHRPALRARAGADRGRRSPSPTCPAAWHDGMRRLLGVEVPDDARGVPAGHPLGAPARSATSPATRWAA